MAMEYFINERGRTSTRNKSQKDTRPLGSPQSWARTPGTLLVGQGAIDGADQVAVEAEAKWGAGRLRLLVSPELREKFDRQRYLFNQAIWHGDLEQVRVQSARMASAWRALDVAAEALGASTLSPEVWEARLEDGTVAAIVRSPEDARAVARDGRKLAVYSLEEIARILSHHSTVTAAKLVWPGATVEAVRRPHDPLDDIRDTLGGIDHPLDDDISMLGA
jgi:hypothetical protein